VKFIFSELKKKKIKKSLHKGVLEANLKMVGKEEKQKKSKKWQKKIAPLIMGYILLFSVIIYVLLGNLTYTKHPFFQYGRIGFIKQKPEDKKEELKYKLFQESRLNMSHYNTFFNDIQIPIRKIFGLRIKTIIIDPGHGGEDPGAIGKLGTNEKDITLDIAKRLKIRLQRDKKYRILMTRETDVSLPLEDRINFANSNRADLYISIHVNYIPTEPINFIETYYFGPHTDRKSLLLAEKENRSTQYTLSDFKEIILKIENTLKTQESNVLALAIQKSLFKNIRKKNKNVINFGIKTAPFIVLLGVDAPSVLTEVTCLSNIKEEKKLNSESYREEIAGYLQEGIENYLNKNKGEVYYAAK
jgi:N-acetylmuramoyl-L-alanine amidase